VTGKTSASTALLRLDKHMHCWGRGACCQGSTNERPTLFQLHPLKRFVASGHHPAEIPMSDFEGKADMKPTRGNVRLWTHSGHWQFKIAAVQLGR
jgi:hypothetical protein